GDPRRAALIARRCATVEAVAEWVRELHGQGGQGGQGGRPPKSTASTASTRLRYSELAANSALVLITVACGLLDRQLAAQAAAFLQEGGFTERLYRVRSEKRRRGV
ncbi:MAG: four helix bundle suffix domain-containing protein, partial [Verrucomicrobiota bacterium]